MKIDETAELDATNPKHYIGPPKVDKKTGKPLSKSGKEPEEDGSGIDDKDEHEPILPTEDPKPSINVQAENKLLNYLKETAPSRCATNMDNKQNKGNPFLANELMGIGLVNNVKNSDLKRLSEENPMRKAMEIYYKSPNSNIQEAKPVKVEHPKSTPIAEAKVCSSCKKEPCVCKKEEAISKKKRLPIIW